MATRMFMIAAGTVVMILNAVFHWERVDNDLMAAIVMIVAVYIMVDVRLLNNGVHVNLHALNRNIVAIADKLDTRARNC